MPLNETHNPELRSWVESANDPNTDFPIQNLPMCLVVQWDQAHGHWHTIPCVAIGDKALSLAAVLGLDLLSDWSRKGDLEQAVRRSVHGGLAVEAWHELMPDLRRALVRFLRHDATGGSVVRRQREKCLLDISVARFARPCMIENYTDFYASRFHAANVGSMFRPDNALLPNYAHVPIGYHGRASSVFVSGSNFHRPRGQTSPPDDNPAAGPGFGPTKMLDYEMELGLYIAKGNNPGAPIPISAAGSHVFGMSILNDWSSRDVQKWEYQPLGPFLAKNFASTVSPFVVTMEALEPFRTAGPRRDPGDPAPLDYLKTPGDWALDINVEVWLESAQMRENKTPAVMLSRGNFKDLYWTIDQLIAHHTVNGCNLRPGDLLGSGTISGDSPGSRGCLLELTWRGIDPDTKKPRPREPITLPTGETRLFLADGDEVIMRAFCARDGLRRIGFGECRARVLPPVE